MQQIFICRKGLEQSPPPDCADNGNEVGRLHPVVDEICKHLADEVEVLTPDRKVIHDEGKYPSYLSRSKSLPLTVCRTGAGFGSGTIGWSIGRCLDELEEAYLLF